jgi:predicted ArsR family transcriptional regulator
MARSRLGRPTLAEQARALGDPTRHAIFRYVAEADEPVGIAELTAHFELNHNAIRQHLAKLVDAALVTETPLGGGRGRPRLVYEINPTAESRWGVMGPYERLSLLLAEVVRTGDAPATVGRRAGQTYRDATSAPDDVIGNIAGAMARLGFDPAVDRRGNRVDVVLGSCPFASAALADPATICSLHLGLAQGLADGTDVVVDELVANDPGPAQCRLRLSVDPGRAQSDEPVTLTLRRRRPRRQQS